MGLKANFTQKDIDRYLAAQQNKLADKICNRMKFVGEKFIGYARVRTEGKANYDDHTRNLRGSTGYIILQNGHIVFESFPGANNAGVQAARSIGAKIVAMKSKANSFVFIGIAGMHYAAYVEAKGKDVISASSQLAAEDLKKSMKELQAQVNAGRL